MENSGWNLSAYDKAELFCRFGSDGIKGQPRNPKNQDAEEIHCLRRYLLPLAEEGLLRYPISICKSESPDFALTWPDSGVTGLEVTKATRGKFEADLTRFDKGEKTQHYRSAPSQGVMYLSEKGWCGDSAEHEWAEYMMEAIQKKTRNPSTYKGVSECDLLVYDNTPTPAPDLKRAVEYLRMLLGGDNPPFRIISVIRDRDLVYDVAGEPRFLSYKSEWDGVA